MWSALPVLELVAGMGHKNEWIVPVEEVSAAGGVPAPPAGGSAEETGPAPAEVNAGKTAAPAAFRETPPAPAVTAVSTAQIEAAVEKLLDRKLSPVLKMIAESRQRRTSLQDVVGGIGYIIGLAGLGAYVHYRRKSRELESS